MVDHNISPHDVVMMMEKAAIILHPAVVLCSFGKKYLVALTLLLVVVYTDADTTGVSFLCSLRVIETYINTYEKAHNKYSFRAVERRGDIFSHLPYL
jgi:hypothetical protein